MTALVLAIVPGPDNLFVLSQSALRGSAAGIAVTFGLCTGLVIHTTIVALGVAVVFRDSHVAFSTLKIAGAAYLIYLAISAFRASRDAIEANGKSVQKFGVMYLRGILMNVTNPKVAIFFLAFLPQFANPGAGDIASQLFVLGGIFIFCTMVTFTFISVAAGQIRNLFKRSSSLQLVLHRISGLIFVLLAIRLAIAVR